jgi:transcriptional regulator with PAS, ATPase and Fis domain
MVRADSFVEQLLCQAKPAAQARIQGIRARTSVQNLHADIQKLNTHVRKEVAMKHLVLTSNGVAGACHAALALMAYPQAVLRITSPRHLADALHEHALRADAATTVHVCGVGFAMPATEIKFALQDLAKTCSCLWYAGSEFPEVHDLARAKLKNVSIVTGKTQPTVEVMRRALKLKNSAQTLLLTKLAEEATQEAKPADAQHRKLHELVTAANRHFYFFGRDDLNEAAIRHLAGLQPVTPALEREIQRYRESDDTTLLLGSSKAMMEIRKLIGKMGPLDEPVLIQGPTGSGKEVVARAIHLASERRGPYVTVNCAVLGGNPTMVEDRLFGHVKGAFTGADRAAKGAFDEASGGTLFLDEIGELPAEVQSQLLRVLQDQRIRPVGTMSEHRVDVRIIAATNRDLRQMVQEGRFREDLYYRLDVLRLNIPPLRERPEDIRSIAAAECEALRAKGRDVKLSGSDLAALRAYAFSGNVRELKTILRRAAYLGVGIGEQLGANTEKGPKQETHRKRAFHELEAAMAPLRQVEASYVRIVYDKLGMNLSKTAQQLGIAPNTVRKHLAKEDEE